MGVDVKDDDKPKEQLLQELRVLRRRLSQLEEDRSKYELREKVLGESDQRVGQKLASILSPEGNLGNLKLADIIDVPAVQSLLNDFHALTHFPLAIIDLQGKVLAGVGWQDICTKFHRVHPEACQHCLESDTQLSEGVAPGEFRLYKCKNNMWDIATPIVVDGKKLGNLFSGQFFFAGEPLAYDLFRSQAGQYGFNETEYLAALERVPRLTREMVEAGMAFLVKLAHMLSLLSFSNIKLARSLTERDALMASRRESEERYRQLVENMSSGVAIYEVKNQGEAFFFRDFNRACERIEVIKREEVIGKEMREVFPGVEEFGLLEVFRRVWRTGTPEHYPMEIYRDDRIVGWRKNYIYKLPSGELVAVYDDVTARQEAEERLKNQMHFVSTLLDTIPCPVFYKDTSGRYLGCNRAFEEFIGKAREEIIGTGVYDFGPSEIADKYAQMDRELFEHPGSQTYEWKVRVADGSEREVIFNKATFPDTAGQVAGLIGVILDITERRQAEEAVAAERQRFYSLLEAMPAYLGLLTPDYQVAFANRYFRERFGEPEGRRCYEYMFGRSEPCENCLAYKVLETKRPEEYEWLGPDGRTYQICDQLVHDTDGSPLILEMGVDITDRKRMEDALRQSEQKFRLLYDNAPLGYQSLDEDGLIVEVNQTWLNILGYVREEVIGRWFGDFLAPGYVDHFLKNFPCFKDMGEICDVQFEMVRRDGASITVSFNGKIAYDAQGRFLRTHCLFQDITARKQAEEKLRDNEQFLTDIFNSIQDGLSILDPELNIIRVNQAMEQLGYSQPMVGRKCYEVYHGFSEPCEVCPAKQTLLTGKAGRKIVTGPPANGSDRFMEIYTFPLLNPASGQVKAVIGFVHDVTESRRAEKTLAEEASRRRLLFEQSRDGIVVLDQTGKVCEANQQYADMLGYALEEVQQLYVWDWDAKWTRQELEEIIRGSKQEGQIFETVHRRKDRTTFDVEICSNKITLAGQKLEFCICRDISQRKHAEAERLRFSKLESLATLAGGIAHDFNNILTAILGNISLATLELQDEKLSRERLTDAERACLQAQTLARQLLTFAKGGVPVKEAISVEKVIVEAASFSCSGSQVRVKFAFADNLWSVEADPGQLNQVFQNLLINAMQAMPNGGTITIRGENLVVTAGSELPLDPGRFVKISFADQGVGMPADYLAKIFDPYFTTKQKGSGLGLATAYSIVKNHHGHLAVQSKLGVGTVFEVHLPASDQKIIPVREKDRGLLIGKGKILVMDDEKLVRQVLDKILGRLGYEAEFARDGNEALELFLRARETGETFAAVILDLTIPGGMGGKEVIRKLLEVDPQVRAIVSSGYSEDPIMADYQKYGFIDIIAKPYKVSELAEVLHQVIFAKI